jgi:hypothetical protein
MVSGKSDRPPHEPYRYPRLRRFQMDRRWLGLTCAAMDARRIRIKGGGTSTSSIQERATPRPVIDLNVLRACAIGESVAGTGTKVGRQAAT